MPEKPRLIVELSDDQIFRLRKNIEWGQQAYIFRKIIDDLNDFIEIEGKSGLALYMTGRLSFLETMKIIEKEREKTLLKEIKNEAKKPKA